MNIRVLHVIGGSRFGGASGVILALAEMARRQGWRVDILATDPKFQLAVRQAGLGLVPMEGIDREIRPLKDLRAVHDLYKVLVANKYTIVHTHTSKGGFVGRLAARLAGVPIIVHTAHGFAIHEASPPWEKISYSLLERAASLWCHRIVCVSNFHRRWGADLRLAPANKLLAIPNGIASDRVRPTAPRDEIRHSLSLRNGEFALLCPGRLARQKGLEDLLQAAALARPLLRCPFRVLFAGEGPLLTDMERLARRLDLSDIVTFLGFRPDIPNLLAASDLVVLPSIREGLSISMLEAMAAGKPIVAASIGSNLELASKGRMAVLVPPQNPVQLAQAIVQVSQDGQMASELAVNGASVFRNYYSEEIMNLQYLNLYVELLTSKRLIEGSVETCCDRLELPTKVQGSQI